MIKMLRLENPKFAKIPTFIDNVTLGSLKSASARGRKSPPSLFCHVPFAICHFRLRGATDTKSRPIYLLNLLSFIGTAVQQPPPDPKHGPAPMLTGPLISAVIGNYQEVIFQTISSFIRH